MADFSEGRLSPSCLEEMDEEALDPRIQDELERLNRASEEINRLELELDDARASFRQALTDSTYKLDSLAKKLGTCVERARPYYDARLRAKEVHVETQKAAYMFERACSMHEAAKEMVQLAEQGYMQREDSADPAWQEMLNHATMKVNDAEQERLESEKVHLKTTQRFKEAEEQVLKLQKDLKRAINKSKLSCQRSFLRLSDIVNQYEIELLPYFEMKAKVNQMMEDRKKSVISLEADVKASKNTYSNALRSLEEISEAIHQKRLEMRNQAELGIRGAGVGSESPSPPPMRGKEPVSIDGKTTKLGSSCSKADSPNTETPTQYSIGSSSQDFRPPSVIYSSADKARTDSYRQAIEARQAVQGNLDSITEDYSVNLDDEYLALPGSSSKSAGTDEPDDVFNSMSKVDSTKAGETQTSSVAVRNKKPAKLKGLILTPVGAGLDPLQASLRIATKPHIAEHSRPASYPYSYHPNNRNRVISPAANSPITEVKEIKEQEVVTPGSEKSGRRLLKVPSVQDFDEGSISDTESVTSGTMLGDDEVEFLTMDFTKCKLPTADDKSETEQAYRRLSLPATLSELDILVRRQLSNDKTDDTDISHKDNTQMCSDRLPEENQNDPERVVEV